MSLKGLTIEALVKAENDIVEGTKRQIEYHIKQERDNVEKLYKNFEGLTKLSEAGMLERTDFYSPYSINLPTEQKDLPKLKTILGCLKHVRNEPTGNDARKPTINVYVSPVAYPGITFYYERKLPRGKNAKCKLVRVKSSYTTLVCER